MGKYHGTRDVKKIHYRMGAALDEKMKIEILSDAFKNRVGYELNLKDPQTMNEKIMWMKLYYQNPLITQCSDKFAVKDYVAKVVGAQYTVPTIASWSDPDEIDFDSLPDQFVLKVNWSSGYNIIVRDKSELDRAATVERLKKWMVPDRNAYYQYFNWGYKHMKPVVYAEKYIEQVDGQVYDYKFFMCGGKFKYMLIATDRENDQELTHDFFDSDFNVLDVSYGEIKRAKHTPEKPKNFQKMIEVAEQLAKPFPFVRVDFYEIGDEIFLGEMTFYPAGGLKPFYPQKFDYFFGSLIPLPQKMITDREGLSNKISAAAYRANRKIKAGLKAVGHVFAHKHVYKQNKSLVLCGIRLPYQTHTEITETCRKRYVHILGLEICYKKLPLKTKEAVNENIAFKYKPNLPMTAFALEGKITPEIQRIHCEQKAYAQLGYFPNLTNPSSLNEKIIWLALNYKNENIKIAADKGRAKDWIIQRVGAEYVIPAIGVYDDVNKIDFDRLPKQFVAKLNDGWGADKIMVVRDKSQLNIDKTKAVLSSWLYPWNNYYYQNMCITDEKMAKPTILIEEYIQQEGKKNPDDFKFYCCNGEPKFALVVSGRGTKEQSRSFVDMEWNVLPVQRSGKLLDDKVEKPACCEEMMRLCRILSEGFPFVRVDFYQVDGKVYVGELTFTPGMFLQFKPQGWDYKLGEYLDLSHLM